MTFLNLSDGNEFIFLSSKSKSDHYTHIIMQYDTYDIFEYAHHLSRAYLPRVWTRLILIIVE